MRYKVPPQLFNQAAANQAQLLDRHGGKGRLAMTDGADAHAAKGSAAKKQSGARRRRMEAGEDCLVQKSYVLGETIAQPCAHDIEVAFDSHVSAGHAASQAGSTETTARASKIDIEVFAF